eukprot:PhF_6_TR10234/c0_g1_i1/m.15863
MDMKKRLRKCKHKSRNCHKGIEKKNKEIEALQMELKAAKLREESLRKRAESAPKHVGRLAPLNETKRNVNPEELGVPEEDDYVPPKRAETGYSGAGGTGLGRNRSNSKPRSGIPPGIGAKRPAVPVKELAPANITPRVSQGVLVSVLQLDACASAGVVTSSQASQLWDYFIRLVAPVSSTSTSSHAVCNNHRSDSQVVNGEDEGEEEFADDDESYDD